MGTRYGFTDLPLRGDVPRWIDLTAGIWSRPWRVAEGVLFGHDPGDGRTAVWPLAEQLRRGGPFCWYVSGPDLEPPRWDGVTHADWLDMQQRGLLRPRLRESHNVDDIAFRLLAPIAQQRLPRQPWSRGDETRLAVVRRAYQAADRGGAVRARAGLQYQLGVPRSYDDEPVSAAAFDAYLQCHAAARWLDRRLGVLGGDEALAEWYPAWLWDVLDESPVELLAALPGLHWLTRHVQPAVLRDWVVGNPALLVMLADRVARAPSAEVRATLLAAIAERQLGRQRALVPLCGLPEAKWVPRWLRSLPADLARNPQTLSALVGWAHDPAGRTMLHTLVERWPEGRCPALHLLLQLERPTPEVLQTWLAVEQQDMRGAFAPLSPRTAVDRPTNVAHGPWQRDLESAGLLGYRPDVAVLVGLQQAPAEAPWIDRDWRGQRQRPTLRAAPPPPPLEPRWTERYRRLPVRVAPVAPEPAPMTPAARQRLGPALVASTAAPVPRLVEVSVRVSAPPEGVGIRALRTRVALSDEGNRMYNCVAGYWPLVRDDPKRRIYHFDEPEAMTVDVWFDRAVGWRLQEAKAICNAVPKPESSRVVVRWLQLTNMALRSAGILPVARGARVEVV